MTATATRSSLHQLSPSKLSAFITSPTMFKARYVLGIKLQPSASMVLGRAFHNALELLGRCSQMDLPVGVDDLLTEFNDALKADIEAKGCPSSPKNSPSCAKPASSLSACTWAATATRSPPAASFTSTSR